jgi:hypothetical protein
MGDLLIERHLCEDWNRELEGREAGVRSRRPAMNVAEPAPPVKV